MANQLFTFVLVILIMGVGLDFLFRASGPRAHAGYRRVVGMIRGFCWRYFTACVRWIWYEYSQFIIGVAAGVLAALYFTGHLH